MKVSYYWMKNYEFNTDIEILIILFIDLFIIYHLFLFYDHLYKIDKNNEVIIILKIFFLSSLFLDVKNIINTIKSKNKPLLSFIYKSYL